jgi:hypothetical protein
LHGDECEAHPANVQPKFRRTHRERAVSETLVARSLYGSLATMSRIVLVIVAVFTAVRLDAAERLFDFWRSRVNETPSGFRSVVIGGGPAAEWKIIEDEVPSVLAPLAGSPRTGNASSANKRPVLAQLSHDGTDERFSLLVYDEESYGDFTFTTRFKIMSGASEQMAGIAFRFQDAKNFYYVRASSLGNTFGFFKVQDGQRVFSVAPKVEVPKGVWHELTIECKANRIHCLLNGREVFPLVTDNSFSVGKIAFWTKSDSVSYFADSKIVYTPREILAETLIHDFIQKYPRLLGIKIISGTREKTETKIIASTDAGDKGKSADAAARSVIELDATYYGREKNTSIVTMPLHDRNGDTVGAVRIQLKSFIGQTEQNAVARALPIVKEMEGRIRSAKDLVE